MKKMWMSLLLLGWGATAQADGDRLIDRHQLPPRAQAFLTDHFGQTEIAFAKEDHELFECHYEVVLVGGEKVEFSRAGEWEEVSCRYASVPKGIVPEAIRAFIGNRHPESIVTEISRNRRGYELQLNNGLELKFDSAYTLIEMDND